MKRNIALVFTDAHLAYSPTTINLCNLLNNNAFSCILALNPTHGFPRLERSDVIYVDTSFNKLDHRLYRFNKRLGYQPAISVEDSSAIKKFRKLFASLDINIVIAVDFRALHIAQNSFKGPIHFVSLELTDSPWLREVSLDRVSSILIQSVERLNYIRKNGLSMPIFYVQNSPIYKPLGAVPPRDPKTILHCGTMQPTFGAYPILNFIKKSDYHIYFKGHAHDEVVCDINKLYLDEYAAGKIIIDQDYLSEGLMVEFMSHFYAGFCFYDPAYPVINTFNYQTAPSGKLFKYLAAGVPVLGIDIPGFKFLTDDNAGVLIKNLSSQSILLGMNELHSNYAAYVENALRVAEKLSFDKMAAPFIEYILSD